MPHEVINECLLLVLQLYHLVKRLSLTEGFVELEHLGMQNLAHVQRRSHTSTESDALTFVVMKFSKVLNNICRSGVSEVNTDA